MWYVMPDSNKQYPLTLERVRKIRSLNQQNILPDELEAVDVTSTKQKEVEPEFVDVVGHISLKSLEKADKKRQQQRREQKGPQGQGNRRQPGPPMRPQSGNKPLDRQAGGAQKGQQQQKPRPQQKKPGPPKLNQQRPPQPKRPPDNPEQKKDN